MFRLKYLKVVLDFFLIRKINSIFIFLLFFLITAIDVSVVVILYKNIIFLIRESNFFYIKTLLCLIVLRYILGIVKDITIKSYTFDEFCFSLRKFFLLLPFNKELLGDNKDNFLQNMLKFQLEINFVNYNAHNFYYHLISYLAKVILLIIVLSFSIFMFPNKLGYLILFALNFIFFAVQIVYNQKFEKFQQRIHQKIQNDLSSINFELSNYIEKIDKKNENFLKQFEKMIENNLVFFKKNIKKNIFFYRFDYFSYFLYSFYCLLGFVLFFYIASPAMNSLIVVYILFNIVLNINLVKLFNIILEKDIFRHIMQSNIFNNNNVNLKQGFYKNTDLENQDNQELNLNHQDQNDLQDDFDAEQNIESSSEIKANLRFIVNSIEFIDVEFTSENLERQINVLHGISFCLEQKGIYYMVNYDNSSVYLFKYLSNFDYLISKGNIMVNGQELNAEKHLWFINFKYIGPETIDLNKTIRENLTENYQKVSEELLIQTCKIVGIFKYINSCDLGFHSIVGDLKLTNLQKFQFSLVCGLLSEAQVFVINFLDLDSEDDLTLLKIKDMISEIFSQRITICLTRHSYGLDLAKKIGFFEKNKLQIFGDHSYLVENNKQYIKFYLSNNQDNLIEE